MGTLRLNIAYRKNRILFSAKDLEEIYLFGIPIQTTTGDKIPESTIDLYTKAATEELEKQFNIRVLRGVVEEEVAFEYDNFKNWGFLVTTYPIETVVSIKGSYNNSSELVYPKEWISVTKRVRAEDRNRIINIIPNSTMKISSGVSFNTISPIWGLFNYSRVPDYWSIKYISGFTTVPADLLNAIGKLASINIFHNMGDLVLGAGVASISIGLDGLSQSIGTTSSATNAAYGSRVAGYEGDLKLLLPKIRKQYGSIGLDVA